MDIVEFLGKNFPKQDVHVVQSNDGWNTHLGYYFWEGGHKKHELQLIRDLRLSVGLDPLEIRQMCAEAKLVKVIINDKTISLVG